MQVNVGRGRGMSGGIMTGGAQSQQLAAFTLPVAARTLPDARSSFKQELMLRREKWTPLHTAAAYGKADPTKFLLTTGITAKPHLRTP